LGMVEDFGPWKGNFEFEDVKGENIYLCRESLVLEAVAFDLVSLVHQTMRHLDLTPAQEKPEWLLELLVQSKVVGSLRGVQSLGEFRTQETKSPL